MHVQVRVSGCVSRSPAPAFAPRWYRLRTHLQVFTFRLHRTRFLQGRARVPTKQAYTKEDEMEEALASSTTRTYRC
jgi:hypothetical protein